MDSGFTVGVKDYDDQGSFRTSLFGSGVKEDPALLPDCDVVVADTVRSNTLFGRQNFSALVENFCGGAIPTAPFVIPYKEAYGRLPAILWEEQRGRALRYLVERDVHTSALRLASFLGTSIATVLKKEAA